MSTERNPNGPANKIWEGSTFGTIWRNESQDGNPKYRTEIGYIYTDREGETRDSNKLRDIDLLRLPSLSGRVRERIREFQEHDKQQQPVHDQAAVQQQAPASDKEQFMQERVQQSAPSGQEQQPQKAPQQHASQVPDYGYDR